MHAFPGARPHAPHAQPLVHTSCEHESVQLPRRVAPAAHTPPPEHAPNALHAPQPHAALQVRVRDCVPQPQDAVSVSVAPAVHSPSPVQVVPPQRQSAPQVRADVPQRPQLPPGSTVPAEHSPLALQEPAFVHAPPTQICCCTPQSPQGTSRGGAPAVQSQATGAVHALHTPLEQRSTPVPHTDEHERSASRPIPGVVSSQSSAAGIPSPSASVAGSTHIPERQTCAAVHAGVQPASPTLRSMISGRSGVSPRSATRVPASGTPPLAHAASTREAARLSPAVKSIFEATTH